MTSIKLICVTAVLTLALGAPSYAQQGSMTKDSMGQDKMMMSDSKMKMSMADKKKMASCQGMSHDMMMKNKGCMKMMKMHPDMMNDGMMKSDMKKGG